MHIKAYSQHPLLQSVIHTIKYMSHVAHKQNRSTYVATAKQEPTKVSFFCLFSCGETCSPRYRHTSMCRRPSRPCHHSANDVLCGPIPVNKLSSHKTRLPIYTDFPAADSG